MNEVGELEFKPIPVCLQSLFFFNYCVHDPNAAQLGSVYLLGTVID